MCFAHFSPAHLHAKGKHFQTIFQGQGEGSALRKEEPSKSKIPSKKVMTEVITQTGTHLRGKGPHRDSSSCPDTGTGLSKPAYAEVPPQSQLRRWAPHWGRQVTQSKPGRQGPCLGGSDTDQNPYPVLQASPRRSSEGTVSPTELLSGRKGGHPGALRPRCGRQRISGGQPSPQKEALRSCRREGTRPSAGGSQPGHLPVRSPGVLRLEWWPCKVPPGTSAYTQCEPMTMRPHQPQ